MIKISLKLLSAIFLVNLICISFSSAQAPLKARYKLLGITVQGNKSADANTIIANSGLKIGDELEIPGDQTMNAIRQLWNLNIFSDVKLEVEKKVQDGVFMVIKVTEYPRIERYVIEGDDDVSEKDIESKINLIRGQTLKSHDLYNIKSRIKALYEEEGLLNAKIDVQKYSFLSADTTSDEEVTITWRNQSDFSDEYKTEYDIAEYSRNLISKIRERILVKFKIEENDKVTVRQIEFAGNKAFDDDELSGTFDETSVKKWWKFWSGSKLNRKKYEEDKKLLQDFYRKNGYRDYELLSDSIFFTNNNKDAKIVLYVYEGPQYKIRNIEWEGNTVYTDDVLNNRLGFMRGDVYDLDKFTKNLRGPNEKQNDVAALYVDNGYLASNFQTTEERVAEDSVDIQVKVTEGNQFKIGKVDITGNEKTKDKVIRRELFTVPTDYFSRSAIFTSLQQLANTQYFNVEKLYTEGVDYFPVDDSTVNVTYKVEEKSSDYLNASVGYSGAYGFSGSVGVTLTNFSLREPFSLGGGQILNFNWQFGVNNFYRTFTLGFTEPWFLDTPTLLGFEVFDTRQQYIYDLAQYGGTVRVGRRLKWPDIYSNIQGFLKYQNNDVRDGRGFYAEGKTQQYTIGGTLSRRNIDNPIFPSQGSSVALDAELSGGPFLPGDVNYYKIQFKAEWYKRLFGTNRVALYTMADLGLMNELDEQSRFRINPFEFFFMGGNGLVIATTPLRGYEDRTIGPRSSLTGEVIGGHVMTRYVTELRGALALEPIPIYVLAFAEAGNVYENISNDTDFFDLKRSVGVGARLLINPIGLIGFDFGYGFDRKSVDGNDPSWIFHFQFGKGF